MKCRVALLTLFSISLACTLLPHAEVRGNEQPNIVLMMGDDHGWEETGYNGHPYVKTPVLDQMAASGLRLDNFYAGHPTCSPTRGSFLTGRHPNRYGTFTPNFSMRPEEISIAHIASQAGYQSAHFGKWHVGPVKKSSPTSPGAMGFNEWLSHDNFFELNPTLSRNGGQPERIEGEGSEVIAREAIAFMRRAKSLNKPYLVVIWFGSPHEPYSGLDKDLRLYDDLPAELADKKVRLTSNETGRPVQRPQRAVLRERYAEITAMDRSIGFVRDYLQETQQAENTLLFYCGDNGTPQEAVAESPLRGQKGQLYEGGIRVPGIVQWPTKIPAPRVSSFTSSTSDLLPTICSIAGVGLPTRPIDGVDLMPLLSGGANNRSQPLFFWAYDVKHESVGEPKPYIPAELQSGTTPLVKLMGSIATRNFRNFVHPKITEADYRGSVAMIDGDYKLMIRRNATEEQLEMYNLDQDRGETTDISGANGRRATEMRSAAQEWQSSVLNSLTGADY